MSASEDIVIESQQTGDQTASQVTETNQHNHGTPSHATNIQGLIEATSNPVRNKEVILEKLGRFKGVLNVIKSVGEALVDVSTIAPNSCIACSSRAVRFIQRSAWRLLLRLWN